MIDQVRSQITTRFTMLVFDFADLEGVNKTAIEEKMRCPLVELFDKQKNADRAKRLLKDDFRKAVALFFHTYQTASGFDFSRLERKLDEHKSVFLRHLGKDKIEYIRLLISIARITHEKPRGLLGVA